MLTWKTNADDSFWPRVREFAVPPSMISRPSSTPGPDHPDTFGTGHNFIYLCGERVDIGRAMIDFEELLTDRLCILGPDHPETITTRDKPAYLRKQLASKSG